MIVSWNWLKEYVNLEMPVEELTHRLTMAGLNLEEVHHLDGDVAIDLEVTSNRPDCLGHLGVAREISVLFELPLNIPPASVPAVSQETSEITSVEIECPDLCPLYVARVIRGVKIGPSPDWLIQRLQASLSRFDEEDPTKTALYRPINNVADITNYVMMECGQPLHAFDFDKLHGGRIIVRRAKPGEKITAIDQAEYQLEPDMCVIADADRPVAIAGVMGGFDTEISEGTVNVLIEAADFAPLAVRNAARKLKLHSPSSYRFERQVDPAQIDWASRRCCELIQKLAGRRSVERSRDRRHAVFGNPARHPLAVRSDSSHFGDRHPAGDRPQNPGRPGAEKSRRAKRLLRSHPALVAAGSDPRSRPHRRSRPHSWLRQHPRRCSGPAGSQRSDHAGPGAKPRSRNSDRRGLF